MSSDKSFAYLHFSEWRTTPHRLWVERGFIGKGRIVLRNKNISEIEYLHEKKLSKIKLINCDLKSSDIRYSKFNESELFNCDWSNCNLYTVSFNKANIQHCNFNNTKLNSDLCQTQIEKSNFSDCELWCYFKDAIIKNCSFRNTEFNLGNNFSQAQISKGDWSGCNLNESKFEETRVDRVNFSNSLMRKVWLCHSNITNCNFQYTDLSYSVASFTIFENCDFRGVNFEYLKLEKAIFLNCGFYNSGGMPQIESIKKSIEIIEPDLSENFDGSNIVDKQTIIKQWKKEIPQIVKEKISQREIIFSQKYKKQLKEKTKEYNGLYAELLKIHKKTVMLYYEDLLEHDLIEKEKEIIGANDAYIQSWRNILDLVIKIIAFDEDWYNDECSVWGQYCGRDWNDYDLTGVKTEEINIYNFLTNELGLIIESYSPEDTFHNMHDASEAFTLFNRLYSLCISLYDELFSLYQELLN